ncbi:MAG: hypothetical protein NC218_05730 [Acetobacter sp.]|nr:hypothetical protein [Acetobacter sp.]
MIKICNIFSGISCNNKTMLYRFGLAWAILLCCMQSAFAVDSEFLTYCVGEKFLEKYKEAECWSCDIIKIMMNAMMTITEKLYQRIKELCLLILQIGGAIWLALYFMKSLGSFAAQDPAKIIDGALTFMFKWALIYAIILGGMDVIMDYIVNPILSIGFDVGAQFAKGSGIKEI